VISESTGGAVPTDDEFRAYNAGVIAAFRANGGVVDQPPFPILLLTTTGARTGQRVTTPVAMGTDDGRVFVVASKGGSPHHPAWYHNLVAHPEVTVELGARTYAARAVVVEGAERDRLYRRIVEQVPTFAEYEQVTERIFPVVVLDGVEPN
jgi:deazaflavin-dependent oxidoreductase (nitroreductase family)